MSSTTLAASRVQQWNGLLVSLWAYLRHELLYLSWALMEVTLLLPVLISAMLWTSFWPPAAFGLWMLAMMLIPFNLSRFLTLTGVPLHRQRLVILGALLLAIFISLRTLLFDTTGLLDTGWIGQLYRHFVEPSNPLWNRDLGIFLLVLFLWWRGLSLTRRRVDIRDMGLRLRIGGLIVAPLVVGITGLYDTPVFGFMLAFFFVSLLAISLTRAEQIALERTGLSYPIRARWLGKIALTSLAVVGAAGFVALVISGRGLEQFVSWSAPLWEALRFFATSLVSIVSYLAFLLLNPLFWLAGRLVDWMRSLNMIPPEMDVEEPELQEMDLEALLREMARPEESIYLWVNRLLLLLFIALLLFLAYLAVSRFLGDRRMVLQGEERTERPAGEQQPRGLRKRLRFWQQWRAAASIRRIYQDMSALAAGYGYARSTSQTPYEYRQTLAELWPQGQEESDLITQAYVRVRYGELPESEQELQALHQAWDHLRRLPPPE